MDGAMQLPWQASQYRDLSPVVGVPKIIYTKTAQSTPIARAEILRVVALDPFSALGTW